MVTVLFELIGAALALGATGGGVAGMLVARAKTRAIAAVGATLPDAAPASESVARPDGGGPFRTLAADASPERHPRRRARRSSLLRHDYDLMIGRTFFR